MTESETRESATPPESDDELRERVADLEYVALTMESGPSVERVAVVHTYLSALLQAKSAGTPDPYRTVAEQRLEIEKLVEKVRGLEEKARNADTTELRLRDLLWSSYKGFMKPEWEEGESLQEFASDLLWEGNDCFEVRELRKRIAAREPSEPDDPSAERDFLEIHERHGSPTSIAGQRAVCREFNNPTAEPATEPAQGDYETRDEVQAQLEPTARKTSKLEGGT